MFPEAFCHIHKTQTDGGEESCEDEVWRNFFLVTDFDWFLIIFPQNPSFHLAARCPPCLRFATQCSSFSYFYKIKFCLLTTRRRDCANKTVILNINNLNIFLFWIIQKASVKVAWQGGIKYTWSWQILAPRVHWTVLHTLYITRLIRLVMNQRSGESKSDSEPQCSHRRWSFLQISCCIESCGDE